MTDLRQRAAGVSMTRFPKASTMVRKHGILPAGFQWRDGRPRWIPSPTLRAKGHKGRDLKDAAGAWLSRGAAIDAAEKINAAIASGQAPTAPAAISARTMKDLFDKLRATRKFSLEAPAAQKGNRARKLKKKTLDGYTGHLKIIEAWCGDIDAGDVKRAECEDFYEALIETRGASMANAIFRTFRLAMNYAVDVLEWIPRNPLAGIEFEKVDGRRVVWTPAQVSAFIEAAREINLDYQAAALVLGVVTVQRLGDVVELPRGELADAFYRFRTNKTGHAATVPIVAQLRACILAERRRVEALFPGRDITTELVDAAGAAITNLRAFNEDFRAVRDFVADKYKDHAAFANMAELQWRDLRDTGITWMFLAGLTDAEIATVTGHSLQTVRAVLDRHYFVRDDAFAHTGGKKLEAFFEAAGMKW